MTAVASPSDKDVRAHPDGGQEGAERFVRFIGLGGVAEIHDDEVSFPLGVLWPYTDDLRRVRTAFAEAGGVASSALLAAIAMLYQKIAFAPGSAGRAVADAYDKTKQALAALAPNE